MNARKIKHAIFFVIAPILVFFTLFSTEIMKFLFPDMNILPFLDIGTKFDILLTYFIILFAAFEIELRNTRNRIEDARNELEKAYGTLYTKLNYHTFSSKSAKNLGFLAQDWNTIAEIMTKYPWMFPEEITNLWRKQETESIGTYNQGTYTISTEFRDKINNEYDIRRKKYNELLGKKS